MSDLRCIRSSFRRNFVWREIIIEDIYSKKNCALKVLEEDKPKKGANQVVLQMLKSCAIRNFRKSVSELLLIGFSPFAITNKCFYTFEKVRKIRIQKSNTIIIWGKNGYLQRKPLHGKQPFDKKTNNLVVCLLQNISRIHIPQQSTKFRNLLRLTTKKILLCVN